MKRKRIDWSDLAVFFLLVGCTVSYSNPSSPSAGHAFTSGLPKTKPADETMRYLREQFMTQTAVANTKNATPGGQASQTPAYATVEVTGTQAPPTAGPATPTPGATGQSTPETAPPVVPTSTTGHPGTYTIHEGEDVYCLGRRFDINPNDILEANDLGQNDILYPGDILILPQNGSPFGGERAKHPHTPNMSYTVHSPYDTIYKIGCYFGDVDPNRIIAANNLKEPYTLSEGQKIIIP
jgi:LysM repeat protein